MKHSLCCQGRRNAKTPFFSPSCPPVGKGEEFRANRGIARRFSLVSSGRACLQTCPRLRVTPRQGAAAPPQRPIQQRQSPSIRGECTAWAAWSNGAKRRFASTSTRSFASGCALRSDPAGLRPGPLAVFPFPASRAARSARGRLFVMGSAMRTRRGQRARRPRRGDQPSPAPSASGRSAGAAAS